MKLLQIILTIFWLCPLLNGCKSTRRGSEDAKPFAHLEYENGVNPPYPPWKRVYVRNSHSSRKIDAVVELLGTSREWPVQAIPPKERKEVVVGSMTDMWNIKRASFSSGRNRTVGP